MFIRLFDLLITNVKVLRELLRAVFEIIQEYSEGLRNKRKRIRRKQGSMILEKKKDDEIYMYVHAEKSKEKR